METYNQTHHFLSGNTFQRGMRKRQPLFYPRFQYIGGHPRSGGAVVVGSGRNS